MWLKLTDVKWLGSADAKTVGFDVQTSSRKQSYLMFTTTAAGVRSAEIVVGVEAPSGTNLRASVLLPAQSTESLVGINS
jgi:hypothetical protein